LYSIKPIQTGPYWFRQGARCVTHSNLFRLVQTGLRQDARCFKSFKPIQTGSNWFRQDARCFTLSHLFKLV
jgi:hypothetical protein